MLASLREVDSPIKVLMVSMFPEDQYAIRCLKAGAQGYLNKAGDPADLITAVRTVAQGREYVTANVAQMLVDNLNTPENTSAACLSERELQTLLKIASGKRLSDIAEELMLSPKTVSVYRARVLEKLKLTNNAEMTVYAIRNGLVWRRYWIANTSMARCISAITGSSNIGKVAATCQSSPPTRSPENRWRRCSFEAPPATQCPALQIYGKRERHRSSAARSTARWQTGPPPNPALSFVSKASRKFWSTGKF